MGRIKRLVLFFVGILMLSVLTACSADIKSLSDSEVVIDGQHVEQKEVTPATDAIPEKDNHNTLPSNSIRPPITKYLITTSKNPVGYANGEVYLTDSYSRGDAIKIEEYWVKENNYWVYHKEIKEFPLNVRLESYPSGGEFGSDLPPNDLKYYIFMHDGVVYGTRNEIIPITPETIRISHYHVRETPDGRWYYHEKPKDLPKKDARIKQVKM